MKRFLVVPLLVTFAFGGTITPIPPETVKKIKQAVESREYTAAVSELEKLRVADEKAFVNGDHDYLLARMAEASGDLAVAMANYQAVATRNSVLAPYALKHLSQIARSTGNLTLERIYLTEMQMVSPDGLMAKSVTLRLARNSFESGDYSKTVGILTSVRDDTGANKAGTNQGMRETKALLADALLRSGQVERAREIFANLLESAPNAAQPDDISLSAAKGLDLLDVGTENAGKRVASLSESEDLRRGNIYQFNRDFLDARLHYLALIAGYPGGANSADAAFQIGRGYAQEGNFVESLKWFERVMEQYPQSPAAKDALLQAASAYGRVGKSKEAIKRYQSFIDKFPTDEKLDRAYMNIVDIHRDQGEDTEALKWCGKARETFKGKLPEAIAVFTEVRIHVAREEWQNALGSLERLKPFTDLGEATVPGGTSVDEVTFLKGFVLENLKKYPEAIDSYLSIPDGRGEYYGGLASERLKIISQNETGRSHIGQSIGLLSAGLKKDTDTRRKNAISILRLTDNVELRKKTLEELKLAIKASPKYSIPESTSPRTEKPKSGDQNILDRLLALGLYDEAAPEIESAGTAAFVDYYKRGDRADRVIALIEPIWRKVPADYPIELIPRDQLELLYPAPYADELLKYAQPRGVDPRLMLAIMRQESRFQPDAKSYAAARGLMQFISTTSARVAGEVGRDKNFSQDDLYHPPTAILFGSQYLADLFKVFPNQPDAVIASYNGGDDNMKRWLARSRSNLPERYVAEVVYAQSKDYVYKVMANYRMYRYLYDDRLQLIGGRLP